jgi:hypothetical protein
MVDTLDAVTLCSIGMRGGWPRTFSDKEQDTRRRRDRRAAAGARAMEWVGRLHTRAIVGEAYIREGDIDVRLGLDEILPAILDIADEGGAAIRTRYDNADAAARSATRAGNDWCGADPDTGPLMGQSEEWDAALGAMETTLPVALMSRHQYGVPQSVTWTDEPATWDDHRPPERSAVRHLWAEDLDFRKAAEAIIADACGCARPDFLSLGGHTKTAARGDRTAFRQAVRAARKNAGPPAPRTASASDRFLVFRRDGFRCVYCGKSAADGDALDAFHVDHFIPWSECRKTDVKNLVTACRECNLGKSNGILQRDAVPALAAVSEVA